MSKYAISIGVMWVLLSVVVGVLILFNSTVEENRALSSLLSSDKAVEVIRADGLKPSTEDMPDEVTAKVHIEGTQGEDALTAQVEVL